MANDEKDKLLKEATALLMDIALKGEVFGDHVQRASEFIAKIANSNKRTEVLPKAA